MAKTTTKKTTGKKPLKTVTMADLAALLNTQHDMVAAVMSKVDKIEREVSLIRSGASFMRELEKAQPAEGQGLEAGDYTDASKEVADALTAVVPKWWEDSDRIGHSFIVFTSSEQMLNTPIKGKTHYPQAEFLARAAVTAKALGLVAVDPKPWKPEINISITVDDGSGKKVIFRP